MIGLNIWRLLRALYYATLGDSIEGSPAPAADAAEVAARPAPEGLPTVHTTPPPTPAPRPALPEERPPAPPYAGRALVVIDPGHGPATKGKRSPKIGGGRFYEWEFNHDVGRRVTALLRRAMIDVVNTAEEWRRLYGTIDNMGNALAFRADTANEAYRSRARRIDGLIACFISIHANAAPQPHPEAWVSGARGIETWYFRPSHRSLELARTIHPIVFSFVGERMGTRDRGLKGSDRLYVLRHTVMPACLLELGFFTHPEEVRHLLDPEVRQAMAEGIAEAIMAYLESQL